MEKTRKRPKQNQYRKIKTEQHNPNKTRGDFR